MPTMPTLKTWVRRLSCVYSESFKGSVRWGVEPAQWDRRGWLPRGNLQRAKSRRLPAADHQTRLECTILVSHSTRALSHFPAFSFNWAFNLIFRYVCPHPSLFPVPSKVQASSVTANAQTNWMAYWMMSSLQWSTEVAGGLVSHRASRSWLLG